MTNIDWTAIRADYEQGLSLRALSAKYDVPKTTLIRKRDSEDWTMDRTTRTGPAQSNTISTPEKSTKENQRLFLEAYAVHANVLHAARAAGIHRTTVYEWLEKDEDFSFAYNLAKEDAKDTLRAEIFRRAHDGWEEPVFQLGQFAGTVRKYSDTLLIFHAKMLMPEYRDKSTVDLNATVGSTDTVAQELRALTNEQLAQFKAWVAEAKGKPA